MSTVIKVENLSKQYRLGQVGTGSLKDDVKRWRYKMMGREDPFSTLGDENDRTVVSKSNYVWALQDVSFSVEKGDIVGIIGRNGAGKSTLLKILARTTGPTKGSLKLKGRIASLLEVGTGFHGELSGRENIFLNGAILGMRKDEIRKKLDEIVDFAGVEKYIDTPVKRYSSGMYVRLAFGVAAHLESEILILDEVLAVGDAEFQKKCLGKMSEVSKGEGKTILFVSHNITAIKSLCDKGILLEKGKVFKDGPIDTVIDSYYHLNKKTTSNFKIWEDKDQPANTWAKIKSIHLDNITQNLSDHISTDDSFAVRICYHSMKAESRIGITVIVSDNLDNIVFCSINNHEKNYYSRPMPNGAYTSRCIIPANFLNSGIYFLSLIVFGPNFTDALDVKDILQIEVIDGLDVRKDFLGTYAGVVRPKLDWETIKQD